MTCTSRDSARPCRPTAFRRPTGHDRQDVLLDSPVLDRLLPALYRRTGVDSRHSVLLETARADRRSAELLPPSQQVDDGGPNHGRPHGPLCHRAPPLALAAADAAWRQSVLSPASATHLITVSCTGFMGRASITH